MYKDSRNVAARHTRAFSYEVVLFRPALGQNIVDRTAESYTALRDHLLLFPTVFFIFFIYTTWVTSKLSSFLVR